MPCRVVISDQREQRWGFGVEPLRHMLDNPREVGFGDPFAQIFGKSFLQPGLFNFEPHIQNTLRGNGFFQGRMLRCGHAEVIKRERRVFILRF